MFFERFMCLFLIPRTTAFSTQARDDLLECREITIQDRLIRDRRYINRRQVTECRDVIQFIERNRLDMLATRSRRRHKRHVMFVRITLHQHDL